MAAQEHASARSPAAPAMPSSLGMIRALGLISLFAGLSVVLVHQLTDPNIEEKERRALESAVFRVIPGIDQATGRRVSFKVGETGLERLDETATDAADLYAVYDAAGSLAGIAMQGAAQGYQDVVRTLFGYDPDCECIVGLTITKSTDTPGMGDKKTVEGNAAFMANFDQLSVALTPDNQSLAHPIETVKHGTKSQPWEIDAISGATITSRAIGTGIWEATARLVPMVSRYLPELTSKPESSGHTETMAVSDQEVIR